MFPSLQLGPLVIPTATFTYLLAIWLGLTLVEHIAPQFNLDPLRTYTLAVTTLMAGFVGARLTFVFIYWPVFVAHPLTLIWPLNNGFSFFGGLFFAFMAAFFYQRYYQLPWPATFDALTPALLLILAATSLADFLTGPSLGTETTLPWAIDIFGIQRHPVQLYELLTAALAALAYEVGRRQRPFPAYPTLVTLATYSAGCLLTDAFYLNPLILGNGWHTLQLLALGILLLSLALLAYQSD